MNAGKKLYREETIRARLEAPKPQATLFSRDDQGRITGFIIDSEQVRDLVFRLR